jgi:3-deoxy-D-manno-octulosonic-acid transferase
MFFGKLFCVKGFNNFFERFSIYKFKILKKKKKNIWVHCSSLGEIRAIEPILNDINNCNIIVTTFTMNGMEYAKTIKKINFACLLPIDVYPIMNNAFNVFKPDILLLVESEFWPTMMYIAFRKNIKIIVINGRISIKSFNFYKKTKFFWTKFISFIDIFIAKSIDDANRFLYLVDNKVNTIVSGNIKYDKNFQKPSIIKNFSICENTFIFTAGSTRKGEDEIIIDVYNKIILEFDNIKFFLAPRHLLRIKKIIKLLKHENIKYSLFSDECLSNNFIIVDIFGKLQNIYSMSDVCYIGGSIVNNGGQNPIEPALYGKPIMFGKNMYNFKEEAENLVNSNGALIVNNSNDLANNIKKFICDKNLKEKIGENAFKAVRSKKGAIVLILKIINRYINE